MVSITHLGVSFICLWCLVVIWGVEGDGDRLKGACLYRALHWFNGEQLRVRIGRG